MAGPKPDHYADLEAAHAWALMQDGQAKRESPLRTPVLATTGLDGAPAVRTVILRAVDAERRTLQVHTDARSAKVQEITAEPRVQVVFHHPQENVQIRATGTATVRRGDARDRAAWAATVPPVRRAYMGEDVPGTPSAVPTGGFPAAYIGRLPSAEESDPAFQDFAVALGEGC
ncbi:MAG: hypothetical protein EXQ86_04590 [Rhodospirillales bacterium]|nr:hypothetical protein [Rhodospirillales bacterium]